jgi:hypothetical protein
MSFVLAEARQYLWRYGVNTDTTVDPIELIRDLAVALEKHEEPEKPEKKPKARPK